MKNLRITTALVASFAFVFAGAAQAAVDSSTASAEIVAALAIENTVALSFGQIAPTAIAGTVTVTPAGGRTGSANVTLGNKGTVTASSFNVTGAPTNTYSITLPGNGDVSLTGPGDPMTVTAFASTPDATGTLDGSGAQTLTVGATLNVGVNQTNGTYAGTFDVTVAYN